MSATIAIATVAITAALVFYTLGVFGERKRRLLGRKHVSLFWLGLCCDTTGTLLMSAFANSHGGGQLGVHAITGALAIALMIIHAIWATAVLLRGKAKARALFSRFSIVVWLIWLVPYICGILIGMPMTHMDAAPAAAIAISAVLVIAAVIALYDTRKRIARKRTMEG